MSRPCVTSAPGLGQAGGCGDSSLQAPAVTGKDCESAPGSWDPLIPGWHHLRQLTITKSDSCCSQTEGLRLGKTELWSSASEEILLPLQGIRGAWESPCTGTRGTQDGAAPRDEPVNGPG